MRRSPQSPNGTNELLVSELCLQGEDIGITRISLNFAMFRSAFEEGAQLGAGPVARLWRALLVFFSRWWQLETLYRSNMKYMPDWVPRFACYEDARLIPRVGIASVIAEGFLVLPFSRRNKQAHRPAHRTTHLGTRQPRQLGPPAARRQRPRPHRPRTRRPPRGRRPAAARAGQGPDGQAEGPAGQGHRRLSRRQGRPATPSPRRSPTTGRDRDGRRPGAAPAGLRLGALRRPARLVRRSPTAVRQFASAGRPVPPTSPGPSTSATSSRSPAPWGPASPAPRRCW